MWRRDKRKTPSPQGWGSGEGVQWGGCQGMSFNSASKCLSLCKTSAPCRFAQATTNTSANGQFNPFCRARRLRSAAMFHVRLSISSQPQTSLMLASAWRSRLPFSPLDNSTQITGHNTADWLRIASVIRCCLTAPSRRKSIQHELSMRTFMPWLSIFWSCGPHMPNPRLQVRHSRASRRMCRLR